MNQASERSSILVLGSGTSVGIPMIGCDCKTCKSDDPRDRRLRPSVLFRIGDRRLLIDSGPDFRYQALRFGIERLDAILYTHAHADHILGIDDVRPFNFMQKKNIPIYGSAETLDVIIKTFPYVFDSAPSESSRPRLTPLDFETNPIEFPGCTITPIRACHGRGTVWGFRVNDCAYLTDHSEIPPESMQQLHGLDVLFLDALRTYAHPTHSTVEKSLATVAQLKPKRAFFTHISHDVMHRKVEAQLPPEVRLAYDGLEVECCPFLRQ